MSHDSPAATLHGAPVTGLHSTGPPIDTQLPFDGASAGASQAYPRSPPPAPTPLAFVDADVEAVELDVEIAVEVCGLPPVLPPVLDVPMGPPPSPGDRLPPASSFVHADQAAKASAVAKPIV